MSVGDIRIYRGAVTDYWGWEVSMDMTARLALALAVLAGCTITPADAAPTQTAPVSGLPAAAVATMPAVPVVPRTTLPAPTTLPAYTHPDPNVERWHALALTVGWPDTGAVVVGAAPSMIVLADGVLLMLLGAAAAIGGFA